MADSRRSESSVERTLRRSLRDAGLPRAQGRAPRWLVAFSGGLDSTVLLHACARVAGPANLVAAHVHHGLQTAADAWPAHCEAQAGALGVAFECLRLAGAPARGESAEAWARGQRYSALAQAARRAGADAVLTAHHADDQVETVLMRIARGTGVDGLAGIEPMATLAGATVLRPLLALRREALAGHAREHRLRWVEDPIHDDTRHARNAVRHRVLPAIDAALPQFRDRLLASVALACAARDAQAALAREDLRRARVADALDRRVLRELDAPRRSAALRAWLRELGLRMPGEARLAQIGRQLIDARGTYGWVEHEGFALARHRDRIEALALTDLPGAPLPTLELRWRAQPGIDLPDGHGRLLFDAAPAQRAGAISARWLAAQTLRVGAGGASAARLRPHPGAPSRTLKNLYQERGVPAWLRPSLPLVHAQGRLLYAAALGADCGAGEGGEGPSVALRWEPARADDLRWRWCERAGEPAG